MTSKIMIVDDTEMNRALLVDLLEDDFDLLCCENGLVCLEHLDQFQPDIILLDVMMPELDGYETCRRIRASEEFSNTCIIMVSAADQAEDKLIGYKAGCDDYLAKPVDSNVLRAKIDVCIKNIAERKSSQIEQAALQQRFLMEESNTLDVMSSFIGNIVKAPNYQALAQVLCDSLKALGVNSAVRIYGIDQSVVIGCEQGSAAWNIIHDAQTMDISGIAQIFRSKHVVVLSKNHAKTLTALLEQIDDRIQILLRGVDARVMSLLKEPNHELSGETQLDIQWLLSENYNAISQAKQMFTDHDLISRGVIDTLLQDMDALLIKLGLTEAQEEALMARLEAAAQDLNNLYAQSNLIEDTLDKSVALLQPMILTDNVDLF